MKWLWFGKSCGNFEEEFSALATATELRSRPSDESISAEALKHLENCPSCQARYKHYQNLAAQLHRAAALPEVVPSTGFRRQWQQRLAARRGEAGEFPSIIDQLAYRLSHRYAGWGALASMWLTAAILYLAAPELPSPRTAANAASVSEIILALRTDPDAPEREPMEPRRSKAQPALDPPAPRSDLRADERRLA